MLEEKVTILWSVFKSMIKDVIVNLLDLIEEVLCCICGDCDIGREELAWSDVRTEVSSHVVSNFSICLVEVVQIMNKRTTLREQVG